MKKHAILSGICLLLLVSLALVPVMAATVTCPPSCSCLYPAEAAKINTPGLCNGKQMVCGGDAKNEKYCYVKPVTATTTVPQLIIAAKPFVTITPTTIAPQKCASGCACLSMADGKAKGLLHCGVKQTLCGYDANNTPLYCFALPGAVTTAPMIVTRLHIITPATTGLSVMKMTPVAIHQPCPSGCTCLPPDKADAAGYIRCNTNSAACQKDPLGRPAYCYHTGRVTAIKPAKVQTTAVPVMAAVNTTRPPLSSEGAGVTRLELVLAKLTGGSLPQSSSPPQSIFCNGTLTNIMADPANCGSCGAFCAEGLECSMGACVLGRISTVQSPCSAFQIQCNGTCSYYLHDDDNCGGCGNRCAIGETCCGGHCTNTNTDPENCHDCGTQCGADAACTFGVCTCTNNTLRCGTRCVDTHIDNENCGGCNYRCGNGKTCCFGACTDTSKDEFNCGTCYHYCSPSHDCVEGLCRDVYSNEEYCGTDGEECGDEQLCCNGICINRNTDYDNCGSCGNACGRGEMCCSGTCLAVSSFSADQDNCGSCGSVCHMTCCGGRCTNTRGDDNNCRTCGHECPWDYPYCVDNYCYSVGDMILLLLIGG